MQKEKKTKILRRYAMLLMTMPVLLGLLLLGVQMYYEIQYSQQRILKETQAYEQHIKNRMVDEVRQAYKTAMIYYEEQHDNMKKEQVEAGIVALLESLSSEDVGYFFAADYDGNSMIGPGKGTNVYDVTDLNGLKVVQALIKTAKEGGGFVTYVMPPLEGMEETPKISYVLPFEPFNWYIGAGVLMSEIESIKATNEEKTYHKNLDSGRFALALTMPLLIILGIINRRIYQMLQTEVEMIDHYITQAIDGHYPPAEHHFKTEEINHINQKVMDLIHKRDAAEQSLSAQYQNLKQLTTQIETTNHALEEEVAEHELALRQLKISENRNQSIMKALPDSVFVLNEAGVLIEYELGSKTPSWYMPGDYLGKTIFDLLDHGLANDYLKTIQQVLKTQDLLVLEYEWMIDGSINYREARMVPFNHQQVLVVLRDVTELKKSQFHTVYLSLHDQLTGVYNRHYFEENLIQLDQDQHYPLGLAIVDVNGLKLTNDAFGHQKGDAVLKKVAAILVKHTEVDNAFVARIGGDEFVLICPNFSESAMKQKVEAIIHQVNKEQLDEIVISVSIGFSIKTKRDQHMDAIFRQAEEQMYHKKLVESQSMRHKTVQVIMKTLSEKNERERIHSVRVSHISRLIAEVLELDYAAIKEIETAGLLHDIGKIAIPDILLNKPGNLIEEEFRIIKKHPESSYQILKAIDSYVGLAEDVLSHHEHYDGTGYPRGLRGEEIPLNARIIAVADAFEAMTSDRTYRKAMSNIAALQELRSCSGKQFDPMVIHAFETKVFAKIN